MKKILIIDDQKMYLMSLEVALKKNYDVKTVTNLQDAIHVIESDMNIEIALIDIRLDENDDSNIDGLKLLEWIKMNRPEISAYIMSAHREFSYAEQALNLGATHFFKKPIDIITLMAILKEKV